MYFIKYIINTAIYKYFLPYVVSEQVRTNCNKALSFDMAMR